MKWISQSLALLGLCITVSAGCSTGYTKSGGTWSYIVLNEAVGREVRKIDADAKTFHVLADPQ